MPQLSLYIDEETLKKVTVAARIENVSISKFVVKKLNESMHDSWPSNFEKIFGSITDDTFTIADDISFEHDTKRESL